MQSTAKIILATPNHDAEQSVIFWAQVHQAQHITGLRILYIPICILKLYTLFHILLNLTLSGPAT